MIGRGDYLAAAQDQAERDAAILVSRMTEADWIAEGKCPECRGEGGTLRHDCKACGGTGEVVFCAVCGLVVEHGLIIRRGAEKLHPGCVGGGE